MTFSLYKTSKRELIDPKAYASGARRDVQLAYAYKGGARYVVWARQLLEVTATAPSWDSVTLTIVLPGVGADSMTITEGARTVYSGAPVTSHTDPGRSPSTAHSYLVVTSKAGVGETGRASVNVTTPARVDMGLTATATSWQQVDLAWADPSGGSVDTYKVFRGSTEVHSGPVGTKAFSDSGLVQSTTYAYTLRAYRAGVEVPTADTASATTPARAAMTLATSAVAWDRATLTWTDPAGDADSFVLRRGSTVVYSGTDTTFTDVGLNPSTAYTWTVEAVVSTVTVGSKSASVSTGAYADLGLVASAAAYNQINLSWAAKNGTADEFLLYRGGTLIYQGAGTSKADTGLAASTGYSYTLHVRRGGTSLRTDTASASTPARPTSSGNVNGPGVGSGYYWTQSTAKTLTSTNVSLPVSCYISSMKLLISGYGTTGTCNPHMDGEYWGVRDVGATGQGGPGWSSMGGGDRNKGAGAHSIGCTTGGASPKASQWQPYSGGGGTTLPWDDVAYWFYSATARHEELRRHAWWRREYEDVAEVHIETWVDLAGDTIRAEVSERRTGVLLGRWER